MAHCEALKFAEVDPSDYLKVAFEVIEAIKNEPNYGTMKPVSLASSWLTFNAAGLGAVFGAKHGDAYVGAIFCLCLPDSLTAEMMGLSYMWGVCPHHRLGGTARILREMFEEWAKNKGAVKLNVGVHHTPWADKQMAARERDGYRLESYSFTKRID